MRMTILTDLLRYEECVRRSPTRRLLYEKKPCNKIARNNVVMEQQNYKPVAGMAQGTVDLPSYQVRYVAL